MTDVISKIHPSWFSVLPFHDVYELVAKKDPSNPYLSQYLIEAFGIEDLTLKAPSVPQELLMLCGLTMNEKKIKGLIRREQQEALMAATSEDAYHFVLERSSFLSRVSLDFLVPEYGFWDSLEQIKEHLIHSGLRCLALAYSLESEDLSRLAFYTLPYEYSQLLESDEGFAALNTEENQKLAHSLISKLAKEVTACLHFSA